VPPLHCAIRVVGYGLNSGHDSVDDMSVPKSSRNLLAIVCWRGQQLMVGGVANQNSEHDFLWEQENFQLAVVRTRHSPRVLSPDYGEHFAQIAQGPSPLPVAIPLSRNSPLQHSVSAHRSSPLLMFLLSSSH